MIRVEVTQADEIQVGKLRPRFTEAQEAAAAGVNHQL
jgi:hypothetical protein